MTPDLLLPSDPPPLTDGRRFTATCLIETAFPLEECAAALVAALGFFQ